MRPSMLAIGSSSGNAMTYEGERWSIVTCAAVRRHRGNERHRRRTAADHDDALAGVVEVLRPLLGMDDGARESLDPLELGRVSMVVVVVAARRRTATSTSS